MKEASFPQAQTEMEAKIQAIGFQVELTPHPPVAFEDHPLENRVKRTNMAVEVARRALEGKSLGSTQSISTSLEPGTEYGNAPYNLSFHLIKAA